VHGFDWVPGTPYIVGFHGSGDIFKWKPGTIDTPTLQHDCKMISAYPDSKLFTTADLKRTITIWDLNQFTTMYELASEDTILNLKFSPDGSRFYDLRDSPNGISSFNAWEPSVLHHH
jgi:WD40 repeat protein